MEQLSKLFLVVSGGGNFHEITCDFRLRNDRSYLMQVFANFIFGGSGS
jgi:hypothetical protein